MSGEKSNWNEEVILSIDAGTQSIRAAIIDLRGNICDIEKTEIEPYFSVYPGWAEQSPDYFWKTLITTCKKLMNSMKLSKETIRGVTVTTQRNTMINLDKHGKPLRPAIIWLDQRRAKKEGWPPMMIKLALKALNLSDVVDHAITECEANWIRQNQPDIWDKTHKYLFLSGFLSYMLTGEYVDSYGNIVGFVPFDYKRLMWAKKMDIKWKMFPMDRSLLPILKSPSTILGYITKKASKDTGIPAGLPLYAAAADKACEVLGSGCITPEIAC